MTSVGVKSVGALFDASVSVKTASQAENHSEDFDATLNNMRVEKRDSANDYEDVATKKSKDDESARFEPANRKNPVKQEEEVTEEQMAAMSDEVAGQIKEMLMEQYGVSEDELNAAMNDMGLTDENLLNVTELTQVVMKLEGVESQADMLTNPDFAKNLKDILTKAEDIKMNVKPEDFNIEEMTGDKTEIEVGDMLTEVTDEVVAGENGTTDEVEAENTDETAATEQAVTVEQATEKIMSDGGNDSKGLLKHEESQEKGAKVDNLNNSDVVQPQDFAKRLTEDLSERVGETKATDIVRQVVEQTQLHVKQGVTSLEMQLYPEHLGKVLVQVVSHDGNITAQITAESEAAKNALESQLTLLKENLNNQGVKVENVEVTIASHAFEQNMQGERNSQQEASQSRRGRRNTDIFFEETGDEVVEEIDKGIMELKGSTVSYMA